MVYKVVCGWCIVIMTSRVTIPVMRLSTNAFSKLPIDTLRRVVLESNSITDVFRRMKLRVSGGQFAIFKRVTAERGIGISHFRGTYTDPKRFTNELPIERLFCKDTSHTGATLRRKALKHGLLEYRCQKCGNTGEWMGEKMQLEVDHISGDRYDNRIENLRFLCPNCHSQTPTHSGKDRRQQYHCPKCGRSYAGYGTTCRKCIPVETNYDWPTDASLQTMVWEQTLSAISKGIGCSLSVLRKRCKHRYINYPPVGYWQRKALGYSHEQSLVSHKRVRGNPKRVSKEDVEQAKDLMTKGYSLRKAAKTIGCSHTTLLDRLENDPVLLLSRHGNAKHNKMAARTGDDPV